MEKRCVLMCRPDYYGVQYEINPWMKVSRQPDQILALSQWKNLKKELKKAGLNVVLIPQRRGLPDMVFVANGAKVRDNIAVPGIFRHHERQGETADFANFFFSLGYFVDLMPRLKYFEGEGDALFYGDLLVCGYGFRSSIEGATFAANLLNVEPVFVRLVDPFFYHLDTCFCPLPDGGVLCYLPAFDENSRKIIERQVDEIIPVSRRDAKNFVCNAVPVGNKLITTPMSRSLKKQLERRGIEPVEVEMSEFIKAGGAAKCLTLWI
jgi:N-dimethylarginine dimethylaminohydrolase